MPTRLFQIDAFATQLFRGNPAAVVPLDAFPADEVMQAIAQENALSETAFFVREGEAFALRWFTPVREVDLCGHATLATAHALWSHLGETRPTLRFETRWAGPLTVTRLADGRLSMSLPAYTPEPFPGSEWLDGKVGAHVLEAAKGRDLICRLESEAAVRAYVPDAALLSRIDAEGLLITAPGTRHDYVARCFFPKLGILEDPVTGSAHAALAPFWRNALGKTQLRALQCSARGGELEIEVGDERVTLVGQAVTYLEGHIAWP